MNLFNTLFGSSPSKDNNSDKIHWIDLIDLLQLEDIISLSQQQPVVIFKHSTGCGISRMALKQFEKEYDLAAAPLTFYYLDILRYRAVSNAIAACFDIVHESPQLLLIKGGKVIYSVSHNAIDAGILGRYFIKD